MTDLAAAISLACAPLAGFCGFAIADDATHDPTLPWIAGVAAVLLTGLMVPVVKWMMGRIDGQSRQDADLIARREKREDERQEAFNRQVLALAAIVTRLESLDDNHKELRSLIDALPERIVTKCNGNNPT